MNVHIETNPSLQIIIKECVVRDVGKGEDLVVRILVHNAVTGGNSIYV